MKHYFGDLAIELAFLELFSNSSSFVTLECVSKKGGGMAKDQTSRQEGPTCHSDPEHCHLNSRASDVRTCVGSLISHRHGDVNSAR